MGGNKMKFTLVLTKEDAQIDDWRRNLSEVANRVDVVWSDVCTLEEAHKQFDDLLKKQFYEYRQLKTVTKWRAVRLYDADGNLIMQEG